MAAGCQAGSPHRSLLRAWSVKLQTHPRAKATATPRGCEGRSPPGPAAALNRSLERGQSARGETEIPPSPSPQSWEALRNVGPPPRLAAQPPIHRGSSALQGDTGSSRANTAPQHPPAGAPPGPQLAPQPTRRSAPEGKVTVTPRRRRRAAGLSLRPRRPQRRPAPPTPRAEPAGTCSPHRAGSRGREGGAHYKSQGALRSITGMWSKLPFP